MMLVGVKTLNVAIDERAYDRLWEEAARRRVSLPSLLLELLEHRPVQASLDECRQFAATSGRPGHDDPERLHQC